MPSFTDPNSKSYARTAGLFYLTVAVAGGYAIAYVPAQLQVAGDAAGTVQNLLARRGLYLSGLAGDVVMMLAELAVTAMLFFMFRAVNPTLSLIAALARFAMVTVMAAMLFFHVGAMALADPNGTLGAFTQAQRVDLVGLMLQIHHGGVWIWQLFFAVHLLVLGRLIVASGVYPRLIGFAMTLGALGYLVDSLHGFALPGAIWLGYLKVVLLAVVTLAELGFALWLVFRGPGIAAPKGLGKGQVAR